MKDSTSAPRVTGLFLVLAALFITLLITSNVTAVKIIQVGGRILPAAIILFPITYILGDVLTEVEKIIDRKLGGVHVAMDPAGHHGWSEFESLYRDVEALGKLADAW